MSSTQEINILQKGSQDWGNRCKAFNAPHWSHPEQSEKSQSACQSFISLRNTDTGYVHRSRYKVSSKSQADDSSCAFKYTMPQNGHIIIASVTPPETNPSTPDEIPYTQPEEAPIEEPPEHPIDNPVEVPGVPAPQEIPPRAPDEIKTIQAN